MNYLNKKSVEDIDVAGRRVLVRYNFNIPFDGEGDISNSRRIDEALKTIRYLINHRVKAILCSHLGHPKGEFNLRYSLTPAAEYLLRVLGQPVQMVKGVTGDSTKTICASLREGEVALLENVRLHKEEERDDPKFSGALASLVETYVNDVFGTVHRAYAPTAGVVAYPPAVYGYLIQKEITVIDNALANLRHPFITILGGAKASDKIDVINNLLDKVDTLIIGGSMAYTFMKALGYSIGTPICENDKLDPVQEMMVKAREKNVKLLIPLGSVVADKYDENANHHVADSDQIPDDWMGPDTGPRTQELPTSALKSTGTVVWNGPMGVSEQKNFAANTAAVVKAVAESGAVSITGGGDSTAAVEQLGFADKMTHISTGGGASLEFLEGLELPGIAYLNNEN